MKFPFPPGLEVWFVYIFTIAHNKIKTSIAEGYMKTMVGVKVQNMAMTDYI